MAGMEAVSAEIARLLGEYDHYGHFSAVAHTVKATPTTIANWSTGNVGVKPKWWPGIERHFNLPPGHLQRIHDGEVEVGATESSVINPRRLTTQSVEHAEVVITDLNARMNQLLDTVDHLSPPDQQRFWTGPSAAQLSRAVDQMRGLAAKLTALAEHRVLSEDGSDNLVVMSRAENEQFAVAAEGADGRPPKDRGVRVARPQPPAEDGEHLED